MQVTAKLTYSLPWKVNSQLDLMFDVSFKTIKIKLFKRTHIDL